MPIMSSMACSNTACAKTHDELVVARAELARLRDENGELVKLVDLLKADVDRYKKAIESRRPNQPERVSSDELQLAFKRIIEEVEDKQERAALEQAKEKDEGGKKERKRKARKKGGRRNLDLSLLRVIEDRIIPPEVLAANFVGYRRIGEVVSSRLGHRRSEWVHCRLVRETWIKVEEAKRRRASPITAPLPSWTTPYAMADASAVSALMLNKYDFCMPLARQERMSSDLGFRIPRSTQCDWLKDAFKTLCWVVKAMRDEAIRSAKLIAMDATGAKVRLRGVKPNPRWSVFVMLADNDHILFSHAESGTSAAVQNLLGGFSGHFLGDAASVYDSVVEALGLVKFECWAHCRRYFWNASKSFPERGHEALSFIKNLFAVEREIADLPRHRREAARKTWAKQIVSAFDKWIERHKAEVKEDPRSPLAAAFTYYENQKEGLHRFLEHPDVPIHNNGSENNLRNLVLGGKNWMHFENESGLEWYTVFRSLIASARLHGLNPYDYIEGLLRLAPHWKTTRTLELAPKYYNNTLSRLDAEQRATLHPPWKKRLMQADFTERPKKPPLAVAS